MRGEIGTCDGCHKVAFPDVVILFGPFLEVPLPVAFELGREAWIVPPVHLHDLEARVCRVAEPLVCRAVLALRVPCHPEFAIFLAQGRNELRPGVIRDRLGLIDPAQENARLGLDAVDVPVETGEFVGYPPVLRSDELLANLVMLEKPVFGADRRLDFLQRRVVQRVHELAGAKDDPFPASLGPHVAANG